jgi:hypothetical protein
MNYEGTPALNWEPLRLRLRTGSESVGTEVLIGWLYYRAFHARLTETLLNGLQRANAITPPSKPFISKSTKNSVHGLEAKTHIRGSILSFRLDRLIFLKKPVSSEAWTVQMTLNAFDDL